MFVCVCMCSQTENLVFLKFVSFLYILKYYITPLEYQMSDEILLFAHYF